MEIKIIEIGSPRPFGTAETHIAKFEKNPTLQHFVVWVLQKQPNYTGSILTGRLCAVRCNNGTIVYSHPLFEEWLDKTIELSSYCVGEFGCSYFTDIVD